MSVVHHRFALAARGSGLRRETVAGLTNLMAGSYLIAVIPSLLAGGGLDRGVTTRATLLVLAAASAFMGLYAYLLFIVGPGHGGSRLLGATLSEATGLGWPTRLGPVRLSGLLLLVMLTLNGAREIVMQLLSAPIKLGLGVWTPGFVVLAVPLAFCLHTAAMPR